MNQAEMINKSERAETDIMDRVEQRLIEAREDARETITSTVMRTNATLVQFGQNIYAAAEMRSKRRSLVSLGLHLMQACALALVFFSIR